MNELELLAKTLNPDLILICETWCNEKISNSVLNIEGYKIELRCDRTNTTNGIGGGLIVYCKHSIKILSVDTDSHFTQFVKFVLSDANNSNDINMYLIYRSPNSSAVNDKLMLDILKSVPKTVYSLVILTCQISTGKIIAHLITREGRF